MTTDPKERDALRNALVTGQVASSLVLVVVALTLARNGAAVGAIDLWSESPTPAHRGLQSSL